MTGRDAVARLTRARTFLFVPGDRPERFEKALTSGADAIVIDLEDAVAPDAKESARATVSAWLDPHRPVLLRINGMDTPWFVEDVALQHHPGLLGIMLPKACGALDETAIVCPIVALVETAAGVKTMATVARSVNVVRLALGAIDLALDLDLTDPDTLLDPIRLQMVVASRAAGLPAPIAGVTVETRDIARIGAEAAGARAAGFGGKLCIHPAQVAPVTAAFLPTAAEIERAQRIVTAAAMSKDAAIALDGIMVDRPVVERARRVLAAGGFTV